jgi:cation transport regulator ChaB
MATDQRCQHCLQVEKTWSAHSQDQLLRACLVHKRRQKDEADHRFNASRQQGAVHVTALLKRIDELEQLLEESVSALCLGRVALLKRIDELEQLLEEAVTALCPSEVTVAVAVAVPLDNESDSEGEDSDL